MNKKFIRNIINLFVLIIILAGISGLYFFKLLPDSKRKENWDKVRLMQNLSENDINKLEISYNDGTNLYVTLLEKISNAWMVTFPLMEKADEESVLKVINDLSFMNSDSIITNMQEEKIKEIGFDRPVDFIKIYLNNSQLIEIINGSRTPTENLYYTLLNQNIDKIYLVACNKFVNIEKKPDDFRNKEIFNIPVQSLKSFELRSASSGLIKFVTETNTNELEFQMILPEKIPVNAFAVKSKIMDVYSISILKYLHDTTDESLLSFYGLTAPVYFARAVSFDKVTNELRIGRRETNGDYYAFSPQKPGIFTIDGDLLTNSFRFRLEEFITNGNTGH